MSTRILNAYLLPFQTLEEVFSWKKKLQKQIEHNARVRLRADVAKRATYAIDQTIIHQFFRAPLPVFHKPEGYEDNILHVAFTEIRNGIREKSTLSILKDYQLSASLCFSHHLCLCILHNSHSDIIRIFKKSTKLKSFDYWDCSDQPENISEHKWNTRKKIWEDALYSGWNPSESGLHFTSIDPALLLWEVKDLPPPQTNPYTRAKNGVRDYLLRGYLQDLDATKGFSPYLQAIDRVNANPKRIEHLAKLIAPTLPMLTTWRALESFPVKLKAEVTKEACE
jgi:hypothetical protein